MSYVYTYLPCPLGCGVSYWSSNGHFNCKSIEASKRWVEFCWFWKQLGWQMNKDLLTSK